MMTPSEELCFHDAILEGLDAADAYIVEQQMTSTLLALCHAQQIEIVALRRNYELARADLARFTASMVA